VKTYIFASTYKIPQLQKDALYRLFERLSTLDEIEYDKPECEFDSAVKYVYAHTATNSSLRQVMVDTFCAHYSGEKKSTVYLMTFPKEFLVDCIIRNARVLIDPDSFDGHWNLHNYHECDNEVVDGK
jgi:hypothetical protein